MSTDGRQQMASRSSSLDSRLCSAAGVKRSHQAQSCRHGACLFAVSWVLGSWPGSRLAPAVWCPLKLAEAPPNVLQRSPSRFPWPAEVPPKSLLACRVPPKTPKIPLACRVPPKIPPGLQSPPQRSPQRSPQEPRSVQTVLAVTHRT